MTSAEEVAEWARFALKVLDHLATGEVEGGGYDGVDRLTIVTGRVLAQLTKKPGL